jgi:D-aspartate ligase
VTVAANPRELREAHARASAAGLKVLVQELIPGPDHLGVNYNAFRARGTVHAECTARKVRLTPPRFGMPSVVLSDDVPEVVEPARAMLAALDLEGFANVEFKRDPRDGIYKFFEINCRHNRSSLLSVRCGLNFPYMAYRYALCGELPRPARARTGVYWIHESAELKRSATRRGRNGSTLSELARPWLRQKVLAVYDRNDTKPFVSGLGRRLPGRLGEKSALAIPARSSGDDQPDDVTG